MATTKSHKNGSTSPVKNDNTEQSNCGPANRVFSLINKTIMPLGLILFVPNLVMMLRFTVAKANGSYSEAVKLLMGNTEGDVIGCVKNLWSTTPIASHFSIVVIGGYCVWALILMVILPGRRVEGTITPHGNIPVYKDNGFFCYVVTMAAFVGFTFYLKRDYGMSPTIVFDRFDEILSSLTLFSLVFCVILYLKGIWFPSSSDNSTTGNPIFDYYWGTELYPRILGIDVKVFTNCRFGLTVWALLVAIFGLKSYETFGFRQDAFVTTVLQLLYITKFFWWEAGYYRTLDIILDRAGFYICWGCLTYVPGLYASVSLYHAASGVDMGWEYSGPLLFIGLISLAVNYWADKQKQDVRAADGNCKIWGKKPTLIRAKYRLESGEERSSLLLASGFWGLSRHFHYLPELMLAFSWSAASGFRHLMPFSYFIFLFILLVHRSFRDDEKCSTKYGKYWQEYRRLVPYKIVPYVF